MCELWRQERGSERRFGTVIQPIFVEESANFSLRCWPSTDPLYRADRFVERWQPLGQRREALDRSGSDSMVKFIEIVMSHSLLKTPGMARMLAYRVNPIGAFAQNPLREMAFR